MVPMADLNPGRPHVTGHEIYNLIPHALNYHILTINFYFNFNYTYLFVYLFIIVIIIIVAIWLLLSAVVILYQGIFLCMVT